MNPRRLLEFFRSPNGRFLLFLLAVALVAVLARGWRNRTPQGDSSARLGGSPDSFVESTNFRTSPFKPVSRPPESPPPTVTLPVKTNVVDRLPPIRVYASPYTEPPESVIDYAPFGRMIRCELVNTVDSANIATPIIGLVMEDVWHAGRLIIPAGAEVHGRAQLDRTRERIASQSTWTIILPPGLELTVSGIALDHAPRRDGSGWDPEDGIVGLHGDLLKTDELAEVKLFASAALAAAAQALQHNQQTIYGLQVLPTARNATLAGGGQVLSSYAQQIRDAFERDGIFVRVPAGKQFYLYVTETIDLSKARIAGTRAYPETRGDTAGSDTRPAKQLISALPLNSIQPLPMSIR